MRRFYIVFIVYLLVRTVAAGVCAASAFVPVVCPISRSGLVPLTMIVLFSCIIGSLNLGVLFLIS
jgi:hypothetical protein